MKKIKLLSLLLCLTLCCLIVFTACVNTPDDVDDDDPNAFTVIRFWNGFTGVDGEAMDKIVADFNRDVAPQYNMTVAVDKLPWDTLFTKITTTSSNLKSAPHIVAMSASRIAGMQAKGVLTPLTGIETYLDVSEDDYISAAWNGGILPNGERYGFPIDVHPTAMYYNKDLISEDELPTTWEEFVQVCQEKTKNGVYGWAVPSMYSISKDVFLNMLYTNGGSVFDSQGNAVYNSQVGVDAVTRLADFVQGTNAISPKDVGAGGDMTLFVQGKSVFYFDGPWVINSFGLFDNENSNIGVAPCPSSVGENDTNFAGSHQFTLMKNTVTNDRIKNLCYIFMKYVNEHSIDWALGGQVPALKSLHQTDEYKALTALQPFTEMAYTATLGEIGNRYWYECYNGLGVAVANAIANVYAPQESLNKGIKDFNDWLVDEAL